MKKTSYHEGMVSKMVRRKAMISTACITFGAGLIIATILPAPIIVFIIGVVLIAVGLICSDWL